MCDLLRRMMIDVIMTAQIIVVMVIIVDVRGVADE